MPRQELPRLKKSAAATNHTVKASLHGAKPPVWRRLELPSDLTLDMVHEVVQIAFAWHGYHLHQFETACGAFSGGSHGVTRPSGMVVIASISSGAASCLITRPSATASGCRKLCHGR